MGSRTSVVQLLWCTCVDKKIINSQDRIDFTPKALETAVVPLLIDANIEPGQVRVVGESLDCRFEVHFPDAPSCKQFHGSLVQGKGKYKVVKVLSPASEEVQIYFNPDKNPATVRKEVLCKQLNAIIQGLLPDGKRAFARKDSGSVLVARQELCAVVIESELVTGVAWNRPLAASLHLVTDSIEEQFKNAGGVLSYP